HNSAASALLCDRVPEAHGSNNVRSDTPQSRPGMAAKPRRISTWGNSGTEPDDGKGISSPERMRPSSCGLSAMESGDGILCRAGCVVEADIDLRGEPGGVGCTRRRGRF